MGKKLSVSEIQDLAVQYFPLAVRLAVGAARKLRAADRDELIGEASLALVESLHTYDPSRGTPLSYWVTLKIRTKIKDHLRRNDLLPQEQRQVVKMLESAERHLEQRYKRKPTEAEIASFLEWSEADVHEARRLAAIGMVSWEDDGVPPPRGRDDVEANVEQRERVRKLHACLATLTVEERVALRMRLAGARLKHIAAALGVSVATADRRVKDALRKLAACMNAETHEPV